MGLDMYLNKKTYVGGNYEYNNVKGALKITRGEKNKPVKVKLNRVTYIEENIAYWRKANHIHSWFVENVQSGVDDCGDYEVSKEKFEKLLNDLKEVKETKDKAPELLPTKSGFFFGETNYDEYYFQCNDYTIKVIEEILKEVNERGYLPEQYFYSSSW